MATRPTTRVIAAVCAGAAMLWGCGCNRTEAPATSVDTGSTQGVDNAGQVAETVASQDTTAGSDAAVALPTSPTCTAWALPEQRGTLQDDKLDELSGLVVSRRHPGVLWTHNDSGEKKARLFAINGAGKLLATFVLPGIDPEDWEDIALGPCSDASPGLDCIYVADTGDNGHARDELTILRVREPESLPPLRADGSAPRKTRVEAEVATFQVRFPSRPDLDGDARKLAEHPNIEAMVVLPDRRVLLFDKRDDGTTTVFRVTLQAGAVAVAERLGSLALADGGLKKGPSLRTTAADTDPTGRFLLLRTYFRVFLLDSAGALLGDVAAADAWLQQAGKQKVSIAHGFDTQGETIAFDPGGGFWHVSEGKAQPIFFVGCSPGR
ncbi:MAG: hypothetical protein H6747_05150 [Deltaproteobacteria bacterium]|nr:hypothetical protein [Deltaproteobacteria bacterium]